MISIGGQLVLAFVVCSCVLEPKHVIASLMMRGSIGDEIFDGNETKDKSLKELSSLQPRITTIESHPATKGFSSISFPKGSIWCGGKPTYWITGHQREDEAPYCEVTTGKWEINTSVVLDMEDEMNPYPKGIDRHSCSAMDVNFDGIPDIICSSGAEKGRGEGFNEVYITQQNGTLAKVPRDHGLQKYPTMRNRFTAVLRSDNGKDLIFFGTKGVEREDGQPNVHRMFRNVYESEGVFPYFVEVPGPWRILFQASGVVVGDFDGDNRDDLVVCGRGRPPLLIQQNANYNFKLLSIPTKEKFMNNWRNVRIADVTDDGLVDLIVVTWGHRSELYIFKGQKDYPYFDFKSPYYNTEFDYSATDVEILDINGDNVADIYIVQMDSNTGRYCGIGDAMEWWGGTIQPPASYTPPLDQANDIVLLGSRKEKNPFTRVVLGHSEPGCGWIAERWDDKTMLLGQGTWDAVGHSLLLEW